jgi:hypothetical protein
MEKGGVKNMETLPKSFMDGPLVFPEKLVLPSWIMQNYDKNLVFPFLFSDRLFWRIEYIIISGQYL